MSDFWYYADAEGPLGPLTLQQLKETLPTLSDPKEVLVWCEDFADWKKAKEVPSSGRLLLVPPPLPMPHVLTSEVVWTQIPIWRPKWWWYVVAIMFFGVLGSRDGRAGLAWITADAARVEGEAHWWGVSAGRRRGAPRLFKRMRGAGWPGAEGSSEAAVQSTGEGSHEPAREAFTRGIHNETCCTVPASSTARSTRLKGASRRGRRAGARDQQRAAETSSGGVSRQSTRPPRHQSRGS